MSVFSVASCQLILADQLAIERTNKLTNQQVNQMTNWPNNNGCSSHRLLARSLARFLSRCVFGLISLIDRKAQLRVFAWDEFSRVSQLVVVVVVVVVQFNSIPFNSVCFDLAKCLKKWPPKAVAQKHTNQHTHTQQSACFQVKKEVKTYWLGLTNCFLILK